MRKRRIVLFESCLESIQVRVIEPVEIEPAQLDILQTREIASMDFVLVTAAATPHQTIMDYLGVVASRRVYTR